MGKFTKLSLVTGLLAMLALVPMSSESKDKNIKLKKIVLSEDNTLILNQEVSGESVGAVITKAKELDNNKKYMVIENKKPIYFFLRTPGGEIQTGIEMMEALKGLKRPVDTVTMFAASMGFQTVQGLGKRYIVKGGVLMSHRARGGFQGEFGGQKPSQIDSRKNLWEQRVEEMDKRTVERTNGKQTLESYQKAYAPELWVTGNQAVEQGYADELVEIQCDESLAGTTNHSFDFMGMEIKYDLDKCPLNSTPMNVKMGKILTTKGLMDTDEFLSKNGGFGTNCLVDSGKDSSKVCAVDTTLSLEKMKEAKQKFKDFYMNIENRTIPMDVNYASDRLRM